MTQEVHQLVAILKQYCPSVKTLIGYNAEKAHGFLVPIRCKRWTCAYCRRINLRILLDRIKRGRPQKFITLTAKHEEGETPEASYVKHRKAVRRLAERIRRTYGKFEYCCITELHKSGFPHWHIVCRCPFVPQQWLSRQWENLTGSKIVDIRRIADPRHAATYVAKYVTKTAGKDRPPWLKRITQFSAGYAAKKKWIKPPGYEWSLDAMPFSAAIEKLEARCYVLQEINIGFGITPPNPCYPDDPREIFDNGRHHAPP